MKKLLSIYVLFCLPLFVSCGDASKEKEESAAEANATSAVDQEKETKTILFFGNSLTAGMGLEETEAFPAIIQQKIDSLDLNSQIINAGLSGETTAAGKNRVDWVLNQDVDVFVLELGANDGLRGVPVEETQKNLQAIIDTVKEKNPETEIILTGMQIPPNMGKEYAEEFRNIFPELADKNDAYLVPFLLEGVAGNPELNQQDRIHPTAEGQRILAENVWVVLKLIINN